ncbi:hypothetical protein C4J87_3384 [Pseudomonas sp. R1-43-08]|nr:hypothetical protein C4J87_3384 [Pseudomonas sp. R1-43-08]
MDFGVPQEQIGHFDRHSSIVLNFKTISPIMLTAVHHRVWMWSELTTLNGATLNTHAEKLLLALQYPLPSVVTGQAVLGKGLRGYEVKALLDDTCSGSATHLQGALDGFFRLMISLHGIFK